MQADTCLNNRILIIDDNESIHTDFRRVLETPVNNEIELDDLEARMFGKSPAEASSETGGFVVDSAFQGEQGFEKILGAIRQGSPYAVAFVDMRMPPGWDGVETIRRLRQVDASVEVVICTAFTDYTWDDIVKKVGSGERIHMVTKPYQVQDIRKLTSDLASRWAPDAAAGA